MKTTINIGLALSLFMAAQIVNAEKITFGSLAYDLNSANATASVCGSASSAVSVGDVVVPTVVTYGGKDYAVTSVSGQAFYKCATITSISLPESVTSIGDHAFRECTALKSVSLPSALGSIGKNCFSNCTALTAIDLPTSLTEIGEWAFQNTAITAVTWPEGVTDIATCTFYNCEKLQSVALPSTVTHIGINAFNTCSKLVSVNLPESLENMESGVFGNCSMLGMIRIPNSCLNIPEQAFYKCSSLRRVIMPDGLRAIGKAAFYECTSLSEITLPDSATDLGSNLFYGCTSLTSVSLPESITYVPEGLLYSCLRIQNFEIPSGVTDIRRNAFFDCEGLSNISIPAGVTNIGAGAFSYCPIAELKLPEALTTIGNNAFYYSALRHINISAKVESIGQAFVVGCNSLLDITVDADNPNYCSLNGVLYDKAGTTLMAYPGGKNGKYVMPEGVTDIADYACNKCEYISGIEFNDQLRRIGLSAFFNCLGLKTLQFPESLEEIAGTAFFTCTSLNRVALPNRQVAFGNVPFYGTALSTLVIPNGQTSLSANSIIQAVSTLEEISLPATLTEMTLIGENCSNLKTIHSFAVTAPKITTIGTTVSNSMTIKVPFGSLASYKAAWSNYYPNAKFVEELPAAAEVIATASSAKISWQAYSDTKFAGEPERYSVEITPGEITREIYDIDAGETITAEFAGLDADTEYAYTVKGYSSYGEETVRLEGKFATEADASVAKINADETNAAEYVDLNGRRVTSPQRGNIYVRITGNGAKPIKY